MATSTSTSTTLAAPASLLAERDARAAAARPEHKDSAPMKIFYLASSILVPPLAVAIKTGDPCETLISFGWWTLGLIPGIVHAVMVSFGDTRCSCAPGASMAVPPGQRIEEAAASQVARSAAATAAPAAAAPIVATTAATPTAGRVI
jgi:uncharacterized membrane protein YqaE (UPF0057 family)